MKNNIKFYEIETKTFFFDKECSHNVKKEGFFGHPDECKKKKSSKSLTIILSKAVPKVTGYQIKIYSSKKKAKKNKGAIWTKVVQTNSKKIVIKNKKLKNKKTLYIRIRAYKRINRKNKYSTWSEIKKVIVN